MTRDASKRDGAADLRAIFHSIVVTCVTARIGTKFVR